jgi:lipid A 3-O-deacylase
MAFACPFATSGYAQNTSSSMSTTLQGRKDVSRPLWQVGAFAVGGFPPDYEVRGGLRYHEELNFYSAGLEAGRMLTASHGGGVLHGRGEAVVEVIPFWLAYHPKQEDLIYSTLDTSLGAGIFPSYSVHGISITPLLFRWNFMRRESSRFVPWVQLGSGLLWTANRFPQGTGHPGGNTSRINFTPQVDFGENIFTRKNQNINLALKVIHISSAGLGEYNPGVNVTVQFSLGYSWWK